MPLPNLTFDPQIRDNLSMEGKVRAKETCSKCRGNFADSGKALVCQACLTTPERFYIDIYWDRQYKKYSDKNSRILSSNELAHPVLTQIRKGIDHKIFDPKDYQTKNYRKLQFEYHVIKWLEAYP